MENLLSMQKERIHVYQISSGQRKEPDLRWKNISYPQCKIKNEKSFSKMVVGHIDKGLKNVKVWEFVKWVYIVLAQITDFVLWFLTTDETLMEIELQKH